MNSPVFEGVSMESIELEANLNAWFCPKSRGIYIQSHAYWKWLESLTDSKPETIHSEDSSPTNIHPHTNNKAVALCPESGGIMVRYQVGHGLPFQIDRSPATGSIWLDAGEWEALKKNNVHRLLHLIFSSSYQLSVASAQASKNLRLQFEDAVGETSMAELHKTVELIKGHPHRQRILAWLREHSK